MLLCSSIFISVEKYIDGTADKRENTRAEPPRTVLNPLDNILGKNLTLNGETYTHQTFRYYKIGSSENSTVRICMLLAKTRGGNRSIEDERDRVRFQI